MALAAAGRRTVLVDADPQGSATDALACPADSLDGSPLYRVLRGEATVKDVLWKYNRTKFRGSLNLIPNSIEMYGYVRQLVRELIITGQDIPYMEIRTRVLEPLRAFGAEWVVIDGQPGFDIPTQMAVASSDWIVIPASPDFASSRGLDNTLQVLLGIMADYGVKRKILGVLPVMIDPRAPRQAEEWIPKIKEIAAQYGVPTFRTPIFSYATYKTAMADALPVWQVDKRPGARAYIDAAQEMEEAVRRISHARVTG